MRFAEWQIGGDRDRNSFFAFSDDLEQQLRAAWVDLDVAEFVEAEQVESTVADDHARQLSFVGGFDELVDELCGGAVADLAALFATLSASLPGPAQAAAQTFSQRESFPAAGSVFTCQGGDLTAQSGMVNNVVHGTVDGQGIFHITGTITVHGVTLSDAAGNVYTLSGASWFGGKSADPEGESMIVATDTEHFVIHNASGGVYTKVQIVERFSPNGKSFTFDGGSCAPPQD